MTRYRLTELTPAGYGRRIYTDRQSVASDVIYAMGGRWRVERQYRSASGVWRQDSGRQPVWEQSYFENGVPR